MKKPGLLATTIAALVLAACHGLGGSVTGNDITGIYYLASVDGSAIPGEVAHDGVPLIVRSGTFIISADGTAFSRTHFVPPGGTEITREVRATYRIEGSRLILRWEGAGITEGEVENDTFTMDNHGMIFEYRRGR